MILNNMTNEEYKKLLKTVPPHNSPEFIDFLKRDPEQVVAEANSYIIIKNCKYHTEENPCHTLFSKWVNTDISEIGSSKIWHFYQDWEMVRWKKEDRSIDRFHIHFFKNGIPKEILESKLK